VLTRFQAASTARTVTVNGAPAVRAVGVPVLPVVVPGAVVSPGTSNCNCVNAPALTVIFGLVFAVSVPLGSLAVIVRVPTVRNVKDDNVRVPETKVMLPAVPPLSSATIALGSVAVIVTFGVAPATTFQFASTALTVIPLAIAVPAACALGEP